MIYTVLKTYFKGKSGTKYSFYIFSLDYNCSEVPAVYIMAKHKFSSFTPIYIDQTDNLKKNYSVQSQESIIKQYKIDYLCVLVEEDEYKRLAIEKDLIKKYKPPCNQKGKIKNNYRRRIDFGI